MTLTVGPNLGLLMHGASGEEHYDELMKRWRVLDAIIQGRVVAVALNTPAPSPADGDCYTVGAAPTGAWVGHSNSLARWSAEEADWDIVQPHQGWRFWSELSATYYRFTGTAWVVENSLKSVSRTADYTLVLGDENAFVIHPGSDPSARTFTVPTEAAVPFDVGSTLMFVNEHGAGELTIAFAGGTVRRVASGELGGFVLAANAMAILFKTSANSWSAVVNGEVPAP
jgi:hypothetical protein